MQDGKHEERQEDVCYVQLVVTRSADHESREDVSVRNPRS